MSTLRVFLIFCLAVVSTGFSSLVSSAEETYFTDGSDQGLFLVRAKDDVGKTRIVGIYDHAMKVGNADSLAKPVVSPGEEVDSFGVKFSLVDAWTLGVAGAARVQAVSTGDNLGLSGESGEKFFIAFGGLANRLVSDAYGNTWYEYVSGIFLKEFSKKNDGTLSAYIRVIFRNGDRVWRAHQNYPKEYPQKDSFDAVPYPDQLATGTYNPKLVEVTQKMSDGVVQHDLFVAFNAVCEGGVSAMTDDDLRQCLVLFVIDPSRDLVPYAAVSERTTWNGISSEFSEMPWNWTLGYDGYGEVTVTIFLPRFIMTVSMTATFCNSCQTSNTRFASVETTVPQKK